MANEKRLDLIDRKALLEKQYNSSPLKALQFVEMVVDVRDIEDAPTVDAVEVVHAEWRYGCGFHNGEITYYSIDCSHCQGIVKSKSRADVEQWKEEFVRCPFCGAIMDGGNEDV